MADVQALKTKISSACALLRSNETPTEELQQAFEFPQGKAQCQEFIRTKTADLNCISRGITQSMQILDTYIKKAMERSQRAGKTLCWTSVSTWKTTRKWKSLEILTIEWLNEIEFLREELTHQVTLISDAAARSSSNSSSEQDSRLRTQDDRCQRIRHPLLEVPTFSGDFREFATFWSVFKSLVHDAEFSDQEKFPVLKQALKGKAATSVSCIPVIGDKYEAAVNILKNQYDRSSSMADILISEKIPRTNNNPKSCRETLSVSSCVIHLEQTAVSLNADRVWRRLILSKFTEHICSTVIRKEIDANFSFDMKDIMDAIDEIMRS